MKFIHVFLFVLIIIGLGLLATQQMWVPKLVEKIMQYEEGPVVVTPEKVSLEMPVKDGKYCFFRSQKATETEPYEVEESIILGIKGTAVEGVKTGTQRGPDMTNGYTGKLKGTKDAENNLELVYDYTIEGSNQKELEIYKLNETSIVKMRWPLMTNDTFNEKFDNDILLPDRSGGPKMIVYDAEECLTK